MGQRMFVAVVPPESVRDDLTDFLEPRSRGALGASALRWIDREQWHITLAFFESVPDHRIDELAERLASAAQRRTPFDMALAGAGAFPSAARASVLWLGVTTGHIVDSGTLDALPSLATNARAAGSVVGAAPDGKSFHPHLTVALLISWLAAVIAIPWLGYKLLPNPHAARQSGRLEKRLPRLARLADKLGLNGPGHGEDHDVYGTPFYTRFRRLVTWCVSRRWLVIGVTIVLFALSIVGMMKVQKQFFPNSTRLELNVELRLPEGASIAAIDAEAKRLELWLAKDKAEFDQFEHYISFVGSGAPRYYLGLDQQLPASNVSQFVIVTRDVATREAVRGRLIKLFENEPFAARGNIARIENGPPVGYPVQYRISGEDLATLRQAATRVASVMRQNSELSNVNVDWSELSKSVEIEIDQDKARLLGVSSQDIAALLNMSLNGYTVTSYREGEKSIDVVLRGDREERSHLSSLADLSVPTRAGKSVPLSQIGRLKHSFEPGLIWRRDRLPTITVRGNLYGKTQPRSHPRGPARSWPAFRSSCWP